MSKSLGNDIAPQTVIEESGAEILRLWVAMVDYREEVRIGPQILARVVEAYRKIRNTLRILVANLYDFDPAADALPLDRLAEVDRYALARYGEVATRVLRAYDRYEFQTVVHTLNNYLTVDLSAFYVDISKDRLYTFGPGSDARRSAQTAIHTIVDGLTRLVAPILPFTADELWRNLPDADADSVHLADFPSAVETLVDSELVDRWTRLLNLRDAVNGELEKLRQDKVVGTSLEAAVTLTADGELAQLLGTTPKDRKLKAIMEASQPFRQEREVITLKTRPPAVKRAAAAAASSGSDDEAAEPAKPDVAADRKQKSLFDF